MEGYYRASKKQLAYISSLYKQLDQFDDTPFVKYSVEKANKKIASLQRKLDKRREDENKLTLF